jgi:hypothetical protein
LPQQKNRGAKPRAATRPRPIAKSLSARFAEEAKNLARLTGSAQKDIEARMEAAGPSVRKR